jgi:hypothetical protein
VCPTPTAARQHNRTVAVSDHRKRDQQQQNQTEGAAKNRLHRGACDKYPRSACGDDAYQKDGLADLILILRPYGVIDAPLHVQYLLEVEGSAQQLRADRRPVTVDQSDQVRGTLHEPGLLEHASAQAQASREGSANWV